MTRLSLVPASELEVGHRFRYNDADHTVTRLDESTIGPYFIDVHVDDREAPVTLLPFILVTLLEGQGQ